MLFSVQLCNQCIRLFNGNLKGQISQQVNCIFRLHHGIVIGDQLPVHLGDIPKRAVVELDNMFMPEVQITGKKDHMSSSASASSK